MNDENSRTARNERLRVLLIAAITRLLITESDLNKVSAVTFRRETDSDESLNASDPKRPDLNERREDV